MSLIADILFKAPPPAFHGPVRTHHPDNKPIGKLRLGIEGIREQTKDDHRRKNRQVLQAIRAGHITVNTLATACRISRGTVQATLLRLIDDKKITRYGAKSTGYFYQEVV